MCIKYILAGILTVLSLKLTSQETEIDFKTALNLAIENNIEIRTQDNFNEVVKANKNENIASFLPNVNLMSFASSESGRQWNQGSLGSNEFNESTINSSQTVLTSTLILFNGMSRINNLRQTNAFYKAQTNQFERTRQNIILRTIQQYIQILLDEEILAISKDDYNNQNLLYEQVRNFVEEGLRPINEQYTQEAQVLRSEAVVLNSENIILNDIANLSLTLQIDLTNVQKIIPPNLELEQLILYEYSLDSLISVALSTRHDYFWMREMEEAARLNRKVANAALLPQLALSYNYRGRFNSNNEENVPFNNHLVPENLTTVARLDLTIPIFNRLQVQTDRVTARVQHENNMLQTQNIEKAISIEVKNTLQDFKTAQKNYRAANAALAAAQRAYEFQAERYELGLADLIELSIENQRLLQSKTAFSQSKYQLYIQKIALEHTTGTLTIQNLN